MKKTLLVVMIAFAALSTYAQKCYVVKADGSQQKAIDIKVKNANGDLNVLVKQGQQPILFSRNMYRYAVVPKPPQVEQLGAALESAQQEGVKGNDKQDGENAEEDPQGNPAPEVFLFLRGVYDLRDPASFQRCHAFSPFLPMVPVSQS